MPKIPDDVLLDVAGFCIKYLNERYGNERGLFRFAVSQTDVRQLQSQIAQKSVTHRDDLDPHLVAEVLQTTYRDLESPLLHEVYGDILNTDTQQNEYTDNKITIQQWLQKLPERKRSLMHSYFRLLSRLASAEETDASLMQLAYSISPTICRPLHCAYMSLRHKEDLNKIRPVLLFLVENYADIFTFTRSFHMGSNAFSIDKDSREAMLSDMMATAMVIDPSSKSNSGLEVRFISSDTSGSEDESSGIHSMPFVKPSLMLSIPGSGNNLSTSGGNFMSSNSSLGTTTSFTSLSAGSSYDDNDSVTSVASSSVLPLKDWSYSDNDWKIFHALVCHKVSRFLDFNDHERQEYMQAEVEGDGHHAVMQAWTAKVNLALHHQQAMHSKLDPSGIPPNSNGNHSPTSEKSPTHANISGANSAGGFGAASSSSSASGNVSNTVGNSSSLAPLGSPPTGNNILQKKHSPKSTLYAKSYARRNKRRKMVAECKGLRAQIQEFEQAFLLQHSRMPKTQERGDMHQFYVKYRELKKEIRETAAKDMQRVGRGFLARRKALRMMHSQSDDAVNHHTQSLPQMYLHHVLPDSNPSDTNMAVSPRDSSSLLNNNNNSSKPGAISSSSAVAATAAYNNSASTSAITPMSANVSSGTGASALGNIPNLSLQLNVELCNYRPTGMFDEDTLKFRDLLYAKRDLKRMLKKFDSDFVEQYGRQPKKADKESMRPMYQKYQEIKTSIEIMRVHMQNYEGQIPEDLRAEVFGTGSTAVSPSNNNSERRQSVGSVSTATIVGSVASHETSDVDMIVVEDLPMVSAPSTDAGPSMTSNVASAKNTRQAFTTSSTPSTTPSTTPGSKPKPNMDELQQEKKNLHEYLKVYERDFNRIHGRPVMKNEDILPVAAEYQRYKELKNLIKEMKQ